MATISVQTKKFADLEALLSVSDSDIMLIHDGNGVKTISVENLQKDIKALAEAAKNAVDQIVVDGAGSHNGIYRGKFLGESVTTEQYAAISDGTFKDLFIGDYWTIGGVNWRIAAFDYYLNAGDSATTKHHAVIVPDTILYKGQMNATNVTTDGYTGSAMHKTGLEQAKTTIQSAFGSSHILTKKLYLDNAVTNGYPSARAWVNSQVELMTEQNVYGGALYAGITNGTNVPNLSEVDKSQYPLFAMRPDLIIANRETYWLRNVVSATYFAFVGADGVAVCSNASGSLGVRPAFCIS